MTDPEFVAFHVKSFGVPANWTSGADTRKVVNKILELYGN
jgi:hypothetical protein